jgi:glutamate racemase
MVHTVKKNHPIGVLDSGIGGLSVANAIFSLLPNEQVHYYADLAHLPYGTKSKSFVRNRVFEIIDFLRAKNCKAIVMACNTASAIALNAARERWPELPIIGMEPAVKPAVAATRTGKVGVLATEGTIGSDRYQRLVDRFAKGVTVIENTCAGLATAIDEEHGPSERSHHILRTIVPPMVLAGVDTFVLGCTHYPFVKNQIQELAGGHVAIIDPSPAVARQLQRVLHSAQLLREEPRQEAPTFYISKDLSSFAVSLAHFCETDYEGPIVLREGPTSNR